MNARADIHRLFESGRTSYRLDEYLDAYRAEVLAEYRAEFTMTEARSIARAHRTAVLHEGADELDRIAAETEARVTAHYGPASGIGPGSADLVREAARTLRAMAGEKATALAATATPGLTARQARLLDAVRTWRGEWTTSRALHLFALTDPDTVTRAAARRDLEQLHRAGHLVLVDEPDNRHFTLALRKDRS